jgi:O-antigen ligase
LAKVLHKVNNFLLYQLSKYLFIFLPISLIIGNFLSNFSIVYIALNALIISIKNKNFSYFKNYYFLFFFIFCAYLILTSLLNGHNLKSLETSITFVRYGFFCLGVIFLVNQDEKVLIFFLLTLIFSLSAVAIDGIYQYFNGVNFLGYGYDYSSKRLGGFFKDEYIIGGYLLRLLPILGALIFYFKCKIKFNLFLITFVVTIIALTIFLSGERLSFFLLVIFLIYILILAHNLHKFIISFGIIITLLIVVVSYLKPNSSQRIFQHTLKQLNANSHNINKNSKDLYFFTKHHSQIASSSYVIFLDNRVFGVGPENYKIECVSLKYSFPDQYCSTHPHNTYLEILVETGVIGFTFILIVYLFLIYHSFLMFCKKYLFREQVDNTKVFLIASGIINLFPFGTSGSFFSSYLGIFYILPIAIYGAIYLGKKISID